MSESWTLKGSYSRMARRFASLVPFSKTTNRSFSAPTGAEEVAAARRAGFMRLAEIYPSGSRKRTPHRRGGRGHFGPAIHRRLSGAVSIQRFVRQHLTAGAFLQSSAGVTLTDLDGNRLYDLTGSYGVNVLGYDLYKKCMERGQARVRELGPVLGAYHPVIATNVHA